MAVRMWVLHIVSPRATSRALLFLVTLATLVAVTPAGASQAAASHMPDPNQVAIVVVGQAAQIRPALEARIGPVRVVTPEACDGLTP